MSSHCCCPGCNKKGKWLPVVVVKMPDNDRPFAFDFNSWLFCDKHKKECTLNDIIGGSVFDTLKLMFKEKFINPPKREHCELDWQLASINIFCNGQKIGSAELIHG